MPLTAPTEQSREDGGDTASEVPMNNGHTVG